MFDPSEFERIQRQLANQLEEVVQKFSKAFSGLPKVLQEAFDSSFAEKFLNVVRRIADANGDTVKKLEKEIEIVKKLGDILKDQAKEVEQMVVNRRKQSREEQKLIKDLLKQAQTQDEINYLQKESADAVKKKNKDVAQLVKLLNSVKAAQAGANAQVNILQTKLKAATIAQQQGLAMTKAFGMTLPQLINKAQQFYRQWANTEGVITGIGVGIGIIVKQMGDAFRVLRANGFQSGQAFRSLGSVGMAQLSGLFSGVVASQGTYAANYGSLANSLGQTSFNRGLTIEAGRLSTQYKVSPEDAARMVGLLNRINNFQAKAAVNSITMVRALANINHIPVGTVMRDMANHTADMAKYAGRGMDQLARGLITARQMGVEFSHISGFADSMVDDFEQSLKTQAELQTYLPGFDFSEVMYASQFGNEDQVLKALKTQLHNVGLKSLDQLPRSVRNRVISLTGLPPEEIAGLLGKNSAEEGGFKTDTSGYSDLTESFGNVIGDFITKNKLATDALGLLAAAASIAAIKLATGGGMAGAAAFSAARAGGSGLIGASGAFLKGSAGAFAVSGLIGGLIEGANSRDQGASWGRTIARSLITGGIAGLGTILGGLAGPAGALAGGIAGNFAGRWLSNVIAPIQPHQLRYKDGYALNSAVNSSGNSDDQKVAIDTTNVEKKLDTLISVTKSQRTIAMDGRTVGRVLTDANSRG